MTHIFCDNTCRFSGVIKIFILVTYLSERGHEIEPPFLKFKFVT